MADVWPVPGGGGAASLLGTSPEQRKRSIPSGVRLVDGSAGLRFPPLWETSGSIPSGARDREASGCLRFPPLWETSGLSLAAVGLRLSWGRLRCNENAAYRRGLALVKTPAALGFPPYGRRLLWDTSVWCVMCCMCGCLRSPPLWHTSVLCVMCCMCGV